MNQVLVGSITTMIGLIGGALIEYIRERWRAVSSKQEATRRSARAMIEREMEIAWEMLRDRADDDPGPSTDSLFEIPRGVVVKARTRAKDPRLLELLKAHTEIMSRITELQKRRKKRDDDWWAARLAMKNDLIDVQTNLHTRMDKLGWPD